MTSPIKPAVLLISFNRAQSTRKSLEAIRQWRPNKLYLACDGPRLNREDDAKNIADVKLILDNIDWPCEVHQQYQSKNLGCKNGPLAAIDWFFENEPFGIILEDDCIPSLSFFDFTTAMLKKYQFNEQIWHVAGSNFITMPDNQIDSYFFSKYPHIWGWGTWRTRWIKAKRNYEGLQDLSKNKFIKNITLDKSQFAYWMKAFQLCKENKMDAWDYMWTYTMWAEEKLAILPTLNLVSNIGFEKNATHHKIPVDNLTNIPAHIITDIHHPKEIHASKFDDRIWAEILKPIFIPSFMKKLKKLFGDFF